MQGCHGEPLAIPILPLPAVNVLYGRLFLKGLNLVHHNLLSDPKPKSNIKFEHIFAYSRASGPILQHGGDPSLEYTPVCDDI